MSTDFEKMMNDKMEQASINDVLPGFNKEQTWDELSQRVHKKKKKVIPLFWTHAAAVAVGLLIGSFTFNMFFNNRNNNTTVITRGNEIQQKVIVRTDTVFITKEIKAPIESTIPNHPINKNNYKPIPQTVIAKQDTEPQIKEVEHAPQQIIEDTESVKEAIALKAKKIKPVHLLDVENEDRNSALYHSDPAAKIRTGFAFQITTDRLPTNNTPEQQPVLRSLFKRKK